MNLEGTKREPHARLMSTTDVAREVGVSSNTIRRMARRGEMPPPLPIGKQMRWRREAVMSWIASLTGGEYKGGWTPLHTAAQRGEAVEVRALVKAGADIEAQDAEGWRPAHWAGDFRHGEALAVLIEAGADLNAVCPYTGQTVEQMAKGSAREVVQAWRRKQAAVQTDETETEDMGGVSL